MRIGIVGGGAIGLLYAFHLTKAFDVTLYVKRKAQLQLISDNGGITVLHQQTEETREITVKLWGDVNVPEDDVIIVAVKQYSLPELMNSLKECSKRQSVFFLQNGMAHIDLLSDLINPRIFLGVVEHGVKKENDFTISWTGKGRTKLAHYPKPLPEPSTVDFTEKWTKDISNDFPIEICPDFNEMMMQKLLVNAIINPLTAIFHVRNGELLTNIHYKKTMAMLYNELSLFVEKNKRQETWEHICTICERTATNWSSMNRDIQEGRETEVDAILGYLKKLAISRGESVPITEFIYEAVKGLQDMK